jgi:hypothetical protein
MTTDLSFIVTYLLLDQNLNTILFGAAPYTTSKSRMAHSREPSRGWRRPEGSTRKPPGGMTSGGNATEGSAQGNDRRGGGAESASDFRRWDIDTNL